MLTQFQVKTRTTSLDALKEKTCLKLATKALKTWSPNFTSHIKQIWANQLTYIPPQIIRKPLG